MATLSERVSQSAFDGSRLRVVLMLDLYDGAQQRFLAAYEQMRHQVAAIPGHISDQLCQSIENPSQWLITSEWESAPPFLSWVNSEAHLETVQPLHDCVRDTRSFRYSVLRETDGAHAPRNTPRRGGLQQTPRTGDGVVRHALTFTVAEGSEEVVAKILADYAPPQTQVDESTRLCRTSLFLHGNRVVRTIEVRGNLMAALRHVARQPEVRAVEEAVNPYLEQERDLDDPASARVFFTRAALPAVHHLATAGDHHDVVRHGLLYPARKGCGMALAKLLAQQDEAAADDPGGLVDGSTVFQRDDVVVRLVDARAPLDSDPVRALGARGPRKAAVLARLLDLEALGVEGTPADEEVAASLLRAADMRLVTDRRAP